MATGVIVGRAADNGDQQCHLRQVELGEWLAEVELAREAEAMDGAVAVLAQEDLIDIGVHEIRLAEVRVQDHGHDGFAHFAAQGAAGIEEVALHQLLGECAAALRELARAYIGPERPGDPHGIDTMVTVEIAIFHGRERLG